MIIVMSDKEHIGIGIDGIIELCGLYQFIKADVDGGVGI